MRVTSNMMIANFLGNLDSINARSLKTQNSISSGLSVTAPSDDPVKASRILYLRTEISKVQQYQENIDHLSMWAEQTAGLQDDVYETFLQAQELAQRGASDLLNQDQKDILAAEVNELLERMLDLSNEKIESYYAFGGNYIADAPFVETRDANGEITAVALDPAGAGQGIDVQRTEEVLDGMTEPVNELGADLFLNGPVDYFQTLIELRDNLRTDTNLDTSIDDVGTAINDVNANLARVAGRSERLEAIQYRLEDTELDYTEAKAGYEETDYVQAVVDLQSSQQAYQAALAVGAQIMQTSLLDFLS